VGERGGIGLVELSMLEALDSLGARSDHRPRRSVRVLQAVDTQIGLAPGYAYQLLVDLAQPWTLAADVRDASKRGNYRFVCVPEPGARPDEIIEQLRLVYGVQTRVPVLLPKPLPRMIRSWVRAFRDEDPLGSLATLEEAIAGQAVPSQ